MIVALLSSMLALATPAKLSSADFNIEEPATSAAPRAALAPLPSRKRPQGPVILQEGQLLFDADPADFPSDLVMGSGVYLRIELGFKTDGRVSSCIPLRTTFMAYHENPPSRHEEIACNALRARARFQFREGYDLGTYTGYYPVALNWTMRQEFEKPIRFVRKSEGIGIRFLYQSSDKGSYRFADKGVPLSCSAQAKGIQASDLPALCSALLASTQFKRQLSHFPAQLKKRPEDGTFRYYNGTLIVSAWIAPQQPKPLSTSFVDWSPIDQSSYLTTGPIK